MHLRSTIASARHPWTQPRPLVAVSAPSGRPALCSSILPRPRHLLSPCRDSLPPSQQPDAQGLGPRQGDAVQDAAAKDVAATSDAAGTRFDSAPRRRQQAVETILASLQYYGPNASAGANDDGVVDLLQQLLPPLLEVRDRLAAHCPAAALTQQQLLAVAQQQLAALQRIEGHLAVAGKRAEEGKQEQHRELVAAEQAMQPYPDQQKQVQQQQHDKEGGHSCTDDSEAERACLPVSTPRPSSACSHDSGSGLPPPAPPPLPPQPPAQRRDRRLPQSRWTTAATPQEQLRAARSGTVARPKHSPPLGTVAPAPAARASGGNSKSIAEELRGSSVSAVELAALRQQVQQHEGAAKAHGSSGHSVMGWQRDPLAGYYDEYDEDEEWYGSTEEDDDI